ncbi:MAG: hypothetical protein ACYTF9_00380 [Planctomycetota bacterium]|jgi:hypothetical protein
MTARVRVLSILLAASIVLAGCDTTPVVDEAAADPGTPAPAYADLAAAHNARVANLRDIACPIGTVELHWMEDEKERWAQGDAEMWIRLPRHTALRLSKLGDDLLWLGSDAERYWLFDLLDDGVTLVTAAHDTPMSASGAGRIPARPLVLLDLLGITPLPTFESGGPTVAWDEEAGGWGFVVDSAAGRVRMVLDEPGRLPIRIDALDADEAAENAVIATSRLREYAPVPIDGLSVLDHPLMAQVIQIEDRVGGRAEFFLRRWSGREEDRARDQLFELDRLRRAMPPDRVFGERAGEPDDAPPP